jgi:toxin-antitoxin system PIN domain toxin
MIAIDSNLLIYAHRSDFPEHVPALALVRKVFEGRTNFGLPWPCLHEFYRVVTEPRLPIKPSSPLEALGAIRAWCAAPRCQLLSEGPAYLHHLAALVEANEPLGAMIHDAKIAAICLSHRVTELWSADRDFSRFPQLSVRNPLRGQKTD